jgi:CheY-like chemotaxis protein
LPDGGRNDYVAITVSDNGPGIPVEIRDRVFEPFFTTKEGGAGTGLGLATVYGIVERLGGMIELSGEPERGAVFRIYLPAAEQGTPSRESVAGQGAALGGAETILLAEDDDLVRGLAVTVLTDAGYRVLTARDGEEALGLLDEHAAEIHLAILDVLMPKRTGNQVYDAIRAEHCEIPVLFSTGYSYGAIDRNQLPRDDAQLIQKPYSPQDLLRKVRSMLGPGPPLERSEKRESIRERGSGAGGQKRLFSSI